MAPSVTVLQLDTHFPRVPGDVACLETYACDVEIKRVENASVGHIVSSQPENIDITPFETAVKSAQGDIIVTSCGFLSYWQSHLAALTNKPFISSSLIALDTLSKRFKPEEILTLTFDSQSLSPKHFGAHADYAIGVVGLPEDLHLRRVITDDDATLDVELVSNQLIELVALKQQPHHKHMLLECTNLPPYKAALQKLSNLSITDILSCIDAVKPGLVHPQFLLDEG